ncbi:Por secretion system C-terminal sorting domain-containing protein [Chryseobacterium taeanense]|uniref:Por secretion system C-terminal sorting domain-containing protein n=1 Tax=Chryseobacterium taeanense TaxID=311334 RepID=A0A1G8GV55_9FLAO|nr:T9SS type A sorting domain-containing protein [Chryseobacterium taeanense]SDH98150.1 Por secretion system C-terminal sorting domain-containing protein [Chryseobacterium taeanense]
MKGKLLPLAVVALSTVCNHYLKAQEYQPMPVTSGYNADVIANGVGPSASSTNNDVDGVSYAFISRDFQLTSASTPLNYGLPINGIINSVVSSTSGLSYQMGSYSSNNSLRLEAANDNGTLIFSTPLQAITVYMLATGGSGSCTVDVDVNFTDNTSETFSGVSISDWYGGSSYAIQGIGRINTSNDNLESGSGTNPRLYQIPLAISTANQSKSVQSVTVTKVGTGGIPNIFAFAADAYNACATPTNITATTTMSEATISWTASASAPASGYQYYYSTSPTPPTATTTPTGSVTSGTSVTLNQLTTGQTYYFWVRSNCGGSSQSFWKMKEFTPGQISTTYTAGDINTQFNNSGVTTTSTTSCPGSLSINVPTGYKIKSTAVSYTMSTVSNGWMAEQRSLLVCTTNNTTEASVTSGSGSSTGTYSYNRTGLTLANDLTGTVNFEMRAWRTYGGSDCNADYNKIDNNTLTVTVTLEPLSLATSEVTAKEKERIAYPNPFIDTLHIEKAENVKKAVLTDLSGVVVKTVENPSSSLFVGEIKSGMYILTLTMKDGSLKSMKTIKR